jgi:hypothetical protein
MWHVWGTTQTHTRVWWRNLKKVDHLEDVDKDNTKMDLKNL